MTSDRTTLPPADDALAPRLHRRRFLGISAAAAGLALLSPHRVAAGTVSAPVRPVFWEGQVMGAPARLILHCEDERRGRELVAAALAEMRRIEAIFSLYRPDSAVSELNRTGALAAPPADLVALLRLSQHVHVATEGAFDPTVQPLWTLYRDHFAQGDPDPSGPPPQAVLERMAVTGLANVVVDDDRIVFLRKGMALTFNGIAQGYATDRVVDILREGGMAHSFVDMGEPRALGARPDGTLWRVGIEDGAAGETIDIADRAVATSAGAGFAFDPLGRFTHLLDPRSGRAAPLHEAVTVVADQAALADALSTAFAWLTPAQIDATLGALGTGRARVLTRDGALHWLGTPRA
jgi:thiamine biosynthesis lipoprotein